VGAGMKVAVLFSIARQVEGEYVFVDVVKACSDADKLRQYLAQNSLERTAVIQGIPCVVEYGVIPDIEVEE
jgi:ABC-type polysaccharide/polyol phosphate transport system ATPase subunit